MDHNNQTFENVRVVADGDSFTDCTFRNVIIEFAGGTTGFTRCGFEEEKWEFGGDLGLGLVTLARLYANDPDRILVAIEGLIRSGGEATISL